MTTMFRAAIVLTAFASAAPARAAGWSFEVDPAASTVTFTLGATAHTVHGTFRVRSGAGTIDPATGSATGRIVVDAASGETGNSSRDRKMHEQVLQSATFPEIVLDVARFEGLDALASGHGADPLAVKLLATIELHGSKHDVTIPLQVVHGASGVEVSGTFRVPYVEWGLSDPSVFILRVNKFVDVSVKFRGSLSPR